MSKGSRRRDAQVSEPEVAQRWEQTFGLLDAVRTPSCDTLTGHMEIRGCEPLPDAFTVDMTFPPPRIVHVPRGGNPILEEVDRMIFGGVGLVPPPSPVTVEPDAT